MFLKLRYDYWLHFMVGYILTITPGLFGYILFGILLTLILAVFKEIRDYFTPGSNFDWMDIVWTLVGIAPALVIIWMKG